jgi:thymidylate synthase
MDLVQIEGDKETKKHEEYQYLEKIAEIMKYGNTRIDRTKIGTKSIFGTQARYSLRNGK